MSEEQARQRAQELTKKALAEAENETFKIDRSLQGKHIVTKSEKAAKKPVKKVCINTFMQTFLLHISHCLHK